VVPIVVVEALLFWRGTPRHLLSWEIGSIIHTLLVSWKVMDTDELPFMTKKVLQRIRRGTLFAVICILVGKLLLAWVELDEASFRVTHPGLCQIASEIVPHWLMLPAFMFFLVNLMLYGLLRQSRSRAHIRSEGREESAFRALILQVDAPVVTAYLLILPYGLIFSHGTTTADSNDFLRGVSCTLLVVSNLLIVAYDYTRVRDMREGRL
jgi:hypothetical protein